MDCEPAVWEIWRFAPYGALEKLIALWTDAF